MIVADINPETIEKAKKEFNVEVVSVDTILEQECDILAPCALGAILNENSIPKIKTQIICGSANNQLAKDSDMKLIEQKGILYCPDYIVNCGGAIVVGSEYTNDPIEVATKKLEQTYDRLTTVFEIAKDKQISTAEAAFELAKSFIRTGLKIKKIDV
ncbi:MAG: hypothetical protein E7Y34_00260 [Mycoplasma sp.]|nr:hypothetical protein [Mycoplasma sp.]